MPLETLRIALAILGVCMGAYFDLFNNKNVPEIFLYGFLAIAFLTNIVAYEPNLFIYATASAAVIFGAFYLLYKAGQLGGADVYILASIALLLPLQPQVSPFIFQSIIPQLPFIANVILVSGISLMIYMIARSIPTAAKFASNPKNLDKKAVLNSFVILVSFGAFSYISVSSGLVPYTYFIFISFLVGFSMYFTLFKQAINQSMVEWADYNGVEPEDIIAIDLMDKEVVLKYSLSRLVDEKMHERMKKIHGNKIAVYKHLPPFVPHILVGLVFSILFGNLILFFSGI